MAAARDSGLPLCIMHMQGEPDSMQANPYYDDVVADIRSFFSERLAACNDCDIPTDRILIDPGFGFGKTPAQNFELLARLRELSALGPPLLVGLSRKSMIASVLDRTPEERAPASIGLAMLAVERGARILRVHDVRETADALAMWRALPHDMSS
jgi:dihydropteroate synthase